MQILLRRILLQISHPTTGLPHRAVTSCTLFNLYINDLIGELNSVPGIKCLLYADDLVFWTKVDKRKAEQKTEHILNKALAILEEWCERNNMKINTSKTAFQSFSLAHKSIHPRLRYKGTALSQSNEIKYLGVTFDKLNWKNHVDKIPSRISKRINMLKRLAGCKWGCAWSTLNLTYQKYILPVITYSCEALVTAQPHTLKALEYTQDQALRLIPGAVKTTPIHAMTYTMGNKPIQEIIKEKAVLLHEKLLRIPGDQYWKTYKNKLRNLKKQNGFIQKVLEIKIKSEINSKPRPLHQRQNPVNVEQIECYLHLQQNTIKGEIGTDTLRQLALETMNTRYPQDKLLHIFTDGSQMDGYINGSAGIYCELFSYYMPLGQHSSTYDGETEAICTALDC